MPPRREAVVEAIAGASRPATDALQLVPFAKAYSGLTDEEFQRVDRVIRATTIEKFGPVRSVRPSLVFELGFEGIKRSTRHKSGIAVRFPRMLRMRDDKPLHEADTLQTLEALAGELLEPFQVALEHADVDQRRVGRIGPQVLAAEAHVVGRLVLRRRRRARARRETGTRGDSPTTTPVLPRM